MTPGYGFYSSNRVFQNQFVSVFFVFLVSLLFASMLASLPIDAFKDRGNYLVYAAESKVIFDRHLSRGILSAVFNEPAWLFVNISLSKFFSPETTLRMIIFFSAFVSSFLVLKNSPRHFLLVLLFLLSPLVIGKYIIHLRQGLAISFFLWGWFSSHRGVRFSLILLAPFIHASFFFVLLLIFIKWFLDRLRFGPDLKVILYVLSGVSVGLGLGYLIQLLGARQASEYSSAVTDVSGLGFLFWTGVFALYASQGKQFCRENIFQIGLLAFYLSTYFLTEVSGRIFEGGVLLVLLSSLLLTSWRKYSFLLAFIMFTGIQYFIRFNQPGLGWGAAA